jgi:putative membrane protein
VIARPPADVINPDAPDPAALVRRAAYDVSYLRLLERHPKLAGEATTIAAARTKGRALIAQAKAARDPETVKAVHGALIAFAVTEIEERLAPIDAEAERIIRAEAVAVGVATAVSMNGTVDAFIVLWRNANLVARLARLYGGRPNLGASLSILRDVAAVVVIARALEDVTDLTGDVIGSLLGRMGGLVAGPVMDGGINAMMTLKIGYLARRRCRSFEGWSPREAKGLSAQALVRVKAASGAVISDLMQRCGGLAASAAKGAESAMAGSKSAWALVQGWFGVKPGGG